MTNGEKFQQIFAVSQVDECDLNVYAWLPIHDAIEIPLEWWNANYSEIPTGSTTKNDSPKYCDRSICLKNEYNNVGCEDCEVTKSQESTTNNDLGVDAISRAQTLTKIEVNASRYTIAKERGGMGQVEWSDQLIKVSDAVDIIRNMPSVTSQEPFINKPCVSSGVCEHDKQNVLDKLRTEIIERDKNIKSVRSDSCCFFTAEEVLEIIDKYKIESEE